MKKIVNASLKYYSGFRTGGICEYLIEVQKPGELEEIFNEININNTKWHIIGYGYNTLISDDRIKGALLRLTEDYNRILIDDSEVISGAGVSLKELLMKCAENGLSGLEFLSGIPGTLGGALFGNVGSSGSEIGDLIETVTVFDTNMMEYKLLKKDDIGFEYRKISIDRSKIITEAKISLKTKNKSDIIKKIKENIHKKARKQPIKEKSCGCVFRNPDNTDIPAGSMIQKAGLSGHKVGDAEISRLHANYIINTGNATAKDIWELIKEVKNSVYEKYSTDLELEIGLLGDGFDG